jgi:hypothetical protein
MTRTRNLLEFKNVNEPIIAIQINYLFSFLSVHWILYIMYFEIQTLQYPIEWLL